MPKIPDLDKMRYNSNLVNFKDFQETIIPKQKMDLVNKKYEDFEIFGEVKEILSSDMNAK